MVSGQKLEVLASSVLDNDFLNDTLKNFMSDDIFHKAKLTSFPSNGKVSFNENGTFVYTPKDDKVERDIGQDVLSILGRIRCLPTARWIPR